ncbi:DEAD-box ATP-dependent RNA helicase 7-like [Olea europaea var. sylvestris]|uniref:DEAD-box ATP-dependent RNA helicase 7-like n=1 Tax=Olea europaea var. sylvestris TaxID=158386 RepID=UPI000C1CEBE2|nr:DEAD-box ATP-dependent RNA helicase 7-like [Olea europaea var. sylvestris]
MPSIVVSESQSPESKKKMKKQLNPETPELDDSVEKKTQKEKKSKKTKLPSNLDSNTVKTTKKDEKKKKKKRNATEIDETDNEEERSDPNSEMGDAMNLNMKKKMKIGNDDEEKVENLNALSNFRISEPLREVLKAKGIESLFPIQAMTFDTILDGADLIGRARTGQGKTLAFVLPILESLTNGPTVASRKKGYGRAPSVLVLLPTRELATQVFSDFEVYGGALGLKSCCLYGGSPYQPQQIQLKRGVDIVVGTPGRIKDHIERGNIDLSSLKFRVLDEADEMLRMGFVEDVELILGCEPPRDVEAYIHRSGRTGRAGKTGVAVMLYDPRKSNFSRIERESGVKFEHISAPQPADIAKAAGAEAAEKINEISDSVIPVFMAAAEELLSTSNLAPKELLAKALAKSAGYTEIKSRSLLTSMENYVTVLLGCGRPVYTPSFAYNVLRRFLSDEKVESIKGLALTADGNGAVFDVAAGDLDTFLAGQENAAGVSLEVVKSLPRLQEREQARGGRFGGGGRGGFSDRRDGRFSGGRGGRGGFSDRRNDRFSRGRGRGNSNW